MSEHTSGPWHWTPYDAYTGKMPILVAADGRDVLNLGNDTQYYPSEGVEPSEADARLIAAAPELLDELENLHRVTWATYENVARKCGGCRVSALIAKAKGETK